MARRDGEVTLMPRPFPLQPVVEITENALAAAERELNRVGAERQRAEQKWQQLVAFRQEYETRLFQSMHNGMNAALLLDYRRFVAKLDLAISQQKQEFERWTGLWHKAHEDWKSWQRKRKSFQVLADRHFRSEAMREEKAEQREQDAFARRISDDNPRGFR